MCSLGKTLKQVESQRILISGGTGFIGRAYASFLKEKGHEVVLLSRTPGKGRIVWSPECGTIDVKTLEGFNAVYHLAGESIMGWWTAAKKRRIYESRVQGTHLLCSALSELEEKPRVLVSASGIAATLGHGFLGKVGTAWEAATQPALRSGIRVFIPRISLVLSPAGGALKSMIPVFQWGLGGPLGSGNQHISWITIDDLVAIFYTAMLNASYEGPMDIVAPEVVTNRVFAQTLARQLRRPAFLRVPACVLKLMLGALAEETLLADVRTTSDALTQHGFRFRYPSLHQALEYLLPSGHLEKPSPNGHELVD